MMLSSNEAFQAMIKYLELYNNRSNSEDIGTIIRELRNNKNSAIAHDWINSITDLFHDERLQHSFQLFFNSDVVLFYKREYIEKSIIELSKESFRIYHLECLNWKSKSDFHTEVAKKLGFPEYYGRNLDAFNDCISDLYPSEFNTAIVFWNFQVLSKMDKEFSKSILDIIQRQSRYAKKNGNQLSALIQTNNPIEIIQNIGAIDAEWNSEEWLNSSRGL